ncbi:diacylglycerol/lipid kinase family protein [Microbacterium sp. DT81.1]|uniref:diacylglycerol/lipid kinase family protein n=1 Tax=Microbacterium sp. DT81.1 TaxID=3393413 RepID=UPI003CFADD98
MPAQRTVAIVVNPSKVVDLHRTRTRVERYTRASGWSKPRWFETDRDDFGVAAALAALATNPDLVCVMGGDGTVRAVSSVLRGTSVSLALLPSGTGNLLARNLGIPVDSVEEALEVAFLGQDRAIDVGLATFDDGEEHVFVVMSGVGLDAEIMAQTDDRLKKRVGWGAYVVAGGTRMFGKSFTATLTVDGEPHPPRESLMVLACNCSSVVANIELATGALLDDELLELVMLQPKAVIGWMGVAVDVAAGVRNGAASLGQWGGKDFHFELDHPVLAEIDGDPIGLTTSGHFSVDPGALLLRLPVPVKRNSVVRAARSATTSADEILAATGR